MEPEQHGQIPSGAPERQSDAPDDAGSRATGSAAGEGGTPVPEARGAVRRLVCNLREGVRLALFLKVDPGRLSVTPGSLAFLVLCDFAINLAVSRLLVGRGGFFAYSSVPSFFFHLPLFLFAGYLSGRVLSRPNLVWVLPVALVSLSIPVELCHALLERLSLLRPLQWLDQYLEAPHYYRFFGWWAAAGLAFLLRIAPAPLGRRGMLLLLFASLCVPLWFYSRGDLWGSSAEGGESGELQVSERVLSAQAHLLDVQLAGLLPGVPGKPHLYFVGFAGDATQDVFLKEVTAAQQLFAERFGAARRSIILANNPQTGTTLPFASATNLQRALTRLGQVMNRDQDVLVLFLTSHGSRDHEFSVNNGPLELDQVTPEMVRGMLSRSGIAYKVLIVSACYAGGFIDPLKDDRTLIMTAADATSESFGCGFGEKFTWFGEALLGQGLRQSYSFTRAFDLARQTIRKWEEEQGETPSNPQIWVGDEIGKKLKALEKELEKQGPVGGRVGGGVGEP